MRFPRFVVATVFCLVVSSADSSRPSAQAAQAAILADWEISGVNGKGGPGTDFDPAPIDALPTCTGCWLKGGQTALTTLSQSIIGVTHGSHSLRIDMVGRGNGGGDGLQDTHFDLAARTVWSITQSDPRALALRDAINSNLLHFVEFDVTYDIPALRSLDWLGPPVDYPNTPERFVGASLFGNANNGGGGFSFPAFADTLGTQFDPFDAQFDAATYVTRHAVVRLDKFNFTPNPTHPPSYFEIGFVINGNWGTNPAKENAQAASVYVDRLVLNRIGECFSLDGDCDMDLDDWALFMSQHLVPNPSIGDFDADGDNDFHDLVHFEYLYDLAHGGPGISSTTVPEPGAVVLLIVALSAMFAGITHGHSRPTIALGFAILIAVAGHSAHAQVVESFDTLGKWRSLPLSDATASISIVNSSLSVSLSINTFGASDFYWAAGTVPPWTFGDNQFEVLRQAVNHGPECHDLLVDVTFLPHELVGVYGLTVSLGLNSSVHAIGVYSGEDSPFTTTTSIALDEFNLPDVEDQGATNYLARIGFQANANLGVPFGVRIDNIRLVHSAVCERLDLDVNRIDGSARLVNRGTQTQSWDYLTIKSASGSLDPTGWNSLDDQDVGGPGTWIEAGGSSPTVLAEASLSGSHSLLPGQSVSLGRLFKVDVNVPDLDLELRREGGTAFRTFDQRVIYIGPDIFQLFGDYNDDAIVDAGDYSVWRDHLGQAIFLPNEHPLQSPGMVTMEDFYVWKSEYGHSLWGGSSYFAVPEPATMAFIGWAFVGHLSLRRWLQEWNCGGRDSSRNPYGFSRRFYGRKNFDN